MYRSYCGMIKDCKPDWECEKCPFFCQLDESWYNIIKATNRRLNQQTDTKLLKNLFQDIDKS